MIIQRLQGEGIRNLAPFCLSCDPWRNAFFGGNGAGKTSVLEALYFLSRGATFRGRKLGPMCQMGSDDCWVRAFGVTESGRPWRRQRVSRKQGRSTGSDLKDAGLGARDLAVRLVGDSVYLLVEGAPELRRRFIDWNLFHVEPRYADVIRAYRRTLEQRNAWLRGGGKGMPIWDEAYVSYCREVDERRREYCELLNGAVVQVLEQLDQSPTEFRIKYASGFNAKSLEDDLTKMVSADLKRGFTFLGPDRADLQMELDGKPGLGSRGENKLRAVILQVAANFVKSGVLAGGDNREIWLIDDLRADLSSKNHQQLLRIILGLGDQVFLTSIEPPEMAPGQLFHVEQGLIKSVTNP